MSALGADGKQPQAGWQPQKWEEIQGLMDDGHLS